MVHDFLVSLMGRFFFGFFFVFSFLMAFPVFSFSFHFCVTYDVLTANTFSIITITGRSSSSSNLFSNPLFLSSKFKKLQCACALLFSFFFLLSAQDQQLSFIPNLLFTFFLHFLFIILSLGTFFSIRYMFVMCVLYAV